MLDACRFIQLHLRGGAPLLERVHAEAMCVPPAAQPGQVHGYGLGLMSERWDGLLVRGHSGGGFGFLADLYWAPEVGIGVAVLTNSTDHPLQESLARQVLTGLAAGETGRRPHVPLAYPTAPAVVSGLVGEYAGRAGWLTIAAEGAGLVLLSGEERHPLRVVGPEEVMWAQAPHERFRLLAEGEGGARNLLRLSDGLVWYRNDVAGREVPPGGGTECAAEYVLAAHGVPISRARLSKIGGVLRYEEPAGTRGLRLEEYQPGIYYSSTGEVLDLTGQPLTYANIRLLGRPGRR